MSENGVPISAGENYGRKNTVKALRVAPTCCFFTLTVPDSIMTLNLK